jgi:hypothetical protein
MYDFGPPHSLAVSDHPVALARLESFEASGMFAQGIQIVRTWANCRRGGGMLQDRYRLTNTEVSKDTNLVLCKHVQKVRHLQRTEPQKTFHC